MRYKPERALTLLFLVCVLNGNTLVEMRYKPERALTLMSEFIPLKPFFE